MKLFRPFLWVFPNGSALWAEGPLPSMHLSTLAAKRTINLCALKTFTGSEVCEPHAMAILQQVIIWLHY